MEQTAPKTSEGKTERARKLAEEIKEHISRGNYADALKSLDAFLEIMPGDHEALITKVQLLVFFNKLRDADKLIDKVIEKFPKDPYAHLTKAIITVLYASDIKAALGHLDKGIDTCPECFELLVAKAQMLYWLGDSSYNLWIGRAERLDKERA